MANDYDDTVDDELDAVFAGFMDFLVNGEADDDE